MKKEKSILKTDSTQSKTWTFTKGNTNLSFTLRVDIKQDLKDFQEILGRAMLEIDAQLASMKK